jgi:hypothetical protein
MVEHTYKPSTQEAETEELWVWGQAGLPGEFKASLIYITRPNLKNLLKKLITIEVTSLELIYAFCQ